ncbi:MAG: hypothetical protein NXY59_03920 [Aigarchaeota archaeon]|nr:hypothetical protein [Candidatus Pelearchaeum maunauluense]
MSSSPRKMHAALITLEDNPDDRRMLPRLEIPTMRTLTEFLRIHSIAKISS